MLNNEINVGHFVILVLKLTITLVLSNRCNQNEFLVIDRLGARRKLTV